MKNKGVFYALGAYFLWGILPIYWKQLHQVPSFQIFAFRIISSLLFLVLVLTVRKNWGAFKQAVFNRKSILLFTLSGVLLGINWLVYIWAVNANHIVETSLGYFINPLVSVALGVIFLREKLRPLQWVPVGMAAAGVVYLTVQYGALPWISLTLAFSFGIYGLLKKIASTGGLYSMTVEMAALCLPALGYLLWMGSRGEGVVSTASLTTWLLLIAAGAITVVPILLFTAAARIIPLALVGILQYVAPTLQFLIGVLLYKEPFTRTDLIGYSIVWAALIIFSLEGTLQRRKTARA
ncbi:MAG: EamA family transporter RarD [Anaerolineaceae bacterium]|jgi:chloramphenicol-sensitive protein RarD|nr:EamA family transporter RarD [Anaerolineaceae bacterium]